MKLARQAEILKLIHQCEIETQEELAEKLNERGFRVTQATVSRDIREMKLTKVTGDNGKTRYTLLQKKEQEVLLDTMNYCDATPSHAQAIILKKLSQSGELTDDKIVDLMEQEKPNQISKIKIREDKIQSVIPKNLRIDNYEDFVVKACEYYGKHLIKNREYER